jgi:ribosomal protein S18 acetylase RimI-like enzyme
MDLCIRTFTEADRISVVRLWHECGLVHPQNDPNHDIDRKLAHGTDYFLVATAGTEVVGSAMGGYEGHRGWVNYVAVSPACRRQGVGRLMMNELERRLRLVGCAKINLQIRSSNAEVMEFYRRIGFVRDDVVCMGRRLIDDSQPEPAPYTGGDASGEAPPADRLLAENHAAR